MAMTKLVKCDKHGTAPGYVVCLHIPQGAKAVFIERATETVLGLAICADCLRQNLIADAEMLICAGCFADMGFVGVST